MAIKALSIFLDYIKLTNFYLNQFRKAIGSQIQVDYNELFGSMLKIDRWWPPWCFVWLKKYFYPINWINNCLPNIPLTRGFQQLCVKWFLLDEIFAYPQSDIPTIFFWVVKHYSEYNPGKKVLMQNFTPSGTKKFQIPGSLPEED